MALPRNLARPKGYKGLMEMMARALGIDLGAAVEEGRIEADEIERLMRRCALCADEGACAHLLAVRTAITATPRFCVNSHILEELKPCGGDDFVDAPATLHLSAQRF